MSNAVSATARRALRELPGVVVSAGLAQKTVKVRVSGQHWNNQVKKYFLKQETHLVHDPNNSLRTGDVVAITPGWRSSQHKRHVVKHIISPYGVPVEERPPIPTEEERIAAKEAKRASKFERRAAKREAELAEREASRTRSKAASSTESKNPKTTSNELD